ncbi:glycosyltransferase family 2 protein [Paenibacillus sacheonensis]|uniref:Glycosyltransferase n=1 Tax=Paenibacillus sacheonensis TaxID=742054 RepID=A0A7X4YWI1_9BACL|nr:glycosyltransferase family A protein [Paenibacillus sacheonensis]MBM7567240.1 glycosyltransferase involved in cell wall biosynthesis [Paenibacillus sacheonensis]NBC72864.1 glycosyltransferase [Paenibacillus sacheonensis]
MSASTEAGVTIITSTIRKDLMGNLFDNYARQQWPVKELIVILNDNAIAMQPYLELAKQHANVRVYRVDERRNLGACLNYAVARAKYPYIAKFDDDDYYSPHYLDESMLVFHKRNADIVGKRSTYFFFPHRSLLLLRKTAVKPYSRCRRIAGPTIMFRKRVFKKVAFSTKVVAGSDARFVRACLKKGFKVYTASSYNFAGCRRANRKSHTWRISEQQLLASKGASIIRTQDFKPHVDRSFDLLPLPDGMKPRNASAANNVRARRRANRNG